MNSVSVERATNSIRSTGHREPLPGEGSQPIPFEALNFKETCIDGIWNFRVRRTAPNGTWVLMTAEKERI